MWIYYLIGFMYTLYAIWLYRYLKNKFKYCFQTHINLSPEVKEKYFMYYRTDCENLSIESETKKKDLEDLGF